MPKLEQQPDRKQLLQLMETEVMALWDMVNNQITDHYEMDKEWHVGRKENKYELKYRRAGKTLCVLFPRNKSFGFMVIYGKAERDKFEVERKNFSTETCAQYDATKTYHDGKWIMLDITDHSILNDIVPLLRIKRKPIIKLAISEKQTPA